MRPRQAKGLDTSVLHCMYIWHSLSSIELAQTKYCLAYRVVMITYPFYKIHVKLDWNNKREKESQERCFGAFTHFANQAPNLIPVLLSGSSLQEYFSRKLTRWCCIIFHVRARKTLLYWSKPEWNRFTLPDWFQPIWFAFGLVFCWFLFCFYFFFIFFFLFFFEALRIDCWYSSEKGINTLPANLWSDDVQEIKSDFSWGTLSPEMLLDSFLSKCVNKREPT